MPSPKELLKTLTLKEKVALLSGQNMWQTRAIKDKGIPSIFMADGPHGLRKQESDLHGGLSKARKATCFPSAALMGSTWNLDLIEKAGEAMGNEAIEQNVDMILGPGINIKRHPFNGRNFEYYSEDPLLSGKMGAALIKGIQSRGIGTSLKHYVANNQETRRMVTDVIVDQKALNETYLKAFEIAVKEGHPWTVMAAYNKVNGMFATEHHGLLSDVLKKEWNYQGAVISDWGAVHDRVTSIQAGLTLEMPSSNQMHDKAVLKQAARSDFKTAIDARVLELLTLVEKGSKKKPALKAINAHHVAVAVAKEGMVLLKNEGALPLNTSESIALIGELADTPRYQGGGSSHINPSHLVTPLDALKPLFKESLTYVKGYDLASDALDEANIQDALKAAKKASQVVIMAGLPDSYESEGYDRTHLNLPPNQTALIQALAKECTVTVVLMNGSPIAMPWLGDVDAVLEAYLGGEGIGEALAEILTGQANPSGKLAETFPLNVSDLPAHAQFPGTAKQVVYEEGIFIGYKATQTQDIPVLFPFGHGLSYSQFTYESFAINVTHETVQIRVDVTNQSSQDGQEVVQVYASLKDSNTIRSSESLVAFKKILIPAHLTTSVTFNIAFDDLKTYHRDAFYLETGTYTFKVGSSVQAIAFDGDVFIKGVALTPYEAKDTPFKTLYGETLPMETPVKPYTLNSTLKDIEHTFIGKKMIQAIQKEMQKMFVGDYDESLRLMFENMVKDMPLRQLISMSNGTLSLRTMHALIALLNKRIFKALKYFLTSY